ncbi:MAG: hypothetical protein JJT99_05740, partial [Rhodobacteraceae bacterium]|nr:hypothetical protein [Paracoccaceae bacterium]
AGFSSKMAGGDRRRAYDQLAGHVESRVHDARVSKLRFLPTAACDGRHRDRQLLQFAAHAMSQPHRPLPALCEDNDKIDVPGP